VFTVTLDGNGDYTFTLQDSLDHDAANGENSLGLSFDLTGTPSSTTAADYDLDPSTLSGVSISQSFSVNVTDDVPEAAEVATPQVADTVTLDEDDLADGTDDTKESLSATGDLGLDGDLVTIDYGADGPADGSPTALQYDDMDWQLEGPSGLFSQGEPVTYTWDANTQTLQASADGRDVFTVTLDGNGDYTFTLQDSIDHDPAAGENSLGLSFDLTGTPSSTTATDYDLDPSTLSGVSISQSFSVNVTDDVPEAAEVATPQVADTVTLDEDDLADGTDDTKESLSATGDLGLDGDLVTIDYGADGPADGSPTALQYDDMDWQLEGPSGLFSQGEPVTYTWDANTQTLQATADGRDVFTVTLDGNGDYTFTLQDSLDHDAANGENSLGLSFDLTGTPSSTTATDYDLDPSTLSGVSISQSFSVNVTDDVPEAAEVATPQVADTVTLDEDDLADGTDDTKESLSATGDLGLDGDLVTIDYGADGPADGSPTALQYGDMDWQLEGPSGLFSQGEPVTYTWDANTQTLQASADGRDVFTVTLDGNGDYTFTLQDSLDHDAANGENSLGLSFDLTGTPSSTTATDYDLDPSTLSGVSISQSFSVNVTDDVPEAAEVATPTVADTVTLDEDDLADGTDDTKESLSATGDLGLDGDLITIDYGADGPADGAPTALQFDDLAFQLDGPAGLTSQGEPVIYTWDANTNTLQASADGRDVFTVEVNSDGSYTFTLQDSLDHDAAGGENSMNIEFTLTGTPDVDAGTDFDLDPGVLDGLSVTQTFSVNVVDDVPESGEVGQVGQADSVSLDEDDLADGTDDTKESLSATGDLGMDGDLITIDYGADGPADGAPTAQQFDDLAFQLDGPSGLTSQGDEVTYTWDANTNTLQATADGRDVFTVELNADGSYTFTLQDSLDHGAANGENSLNLEFSLTGTPADGTATDYDLDPTALSGLSISQTFSVNVVDDVPEALEGNVGQSTGVTVDEDDLADGTDDTKESLSATGDLGMGGDLFTIDYGADGPADGAPTALQFDDLAFQLDGPSGLTSQGEPVTYTWDANTNTLQASADGRDVFTVELNTDGTYTFTLQDSLDHAAGGGENALALDFTLTGSPGADAISDAADYDLDPAQLEGMSVSQTFSVNVTDDVPEAAVHQPDPVGGGSGGEYLTVTNMGQESAAYNNTYGYYIQDENGEPTSGQIIWSNTKEDVGETFTIDGVDPDSVGFFVIPNGFSLNNDLENGMDVTFQQDGDGNWQVVGPDNQVLNGQGTGAIFTNQALNEDGLDHEQDSPAPGDQNWEDIHNGGDLDYNDVNMEVERVETTVSVDEDDLADGTDDTKESLSASGTLGLDGDLVTIDYGADGPAAGAPTALGYGDLDWQLDGPSGLTSQGAEVTYTWDANTNTLQATADGRDVFTVELNADGTFTFTLQDSLDHASADGENSMDLEFSLTGTPDGDLVTDFDLDPALLGDVSINQTFSVNVVDDVPETGEVGQVGQAESVSLDEDDLADGTDDTKESLSATGDLGMDGDLITIDYGADGPADGAPTALQFGDLAFQLDGPTGLSSQGKPVTYSWDANTNTLQASADGRDVFTVEVNSDGSYTFTLQDSLDHAAAGGENSMNLEFTLTGTPDVAAGTDYDLDPSALEGLSVSQTFSVNVVDDVPEAAEVGQVGQAESVSLDEDDLADGTDATKESLSASGELGLDGDLITIDYGADGAADGAPVTLGYGDLDFQLTGPAGLTSEGEEVTYTWDANTNTLQASADGRDVFTVELNADGTYTFTLQDSLDHAPGQGQNQMALEFGLVGTPSAAASTDYDLDPTSLAGASVSQNFTVNIVDDVPQAADDTDSVSYHVGDQTSGNVISGVDPDTDDVHTDELAADTASADPSLHITSLSNGSQTVSFSNPGDVQSDDNGNYIELAGEHGTVKMYENGSYTYTVTDEDALIEPVTVSAGGGDQQSWSNVGLYAFDFGTSFENGSGQFDVSLADDTVVFTGNGIGVEGTQGGMPVPNQINHDATTGETQALAIDLKSPSTSASVKVSNLFNDEEDGEVGTWRAYDANGNLVGQGTLDSSTVDYGSSNNVGEASINISMGSHCDTPFQYLVFTAEPYADESDNPETGDSSDFYIRSVEFETDYSFGMEEFSYTIADGDGDESSATLTINMTDLDHPEPPVPEDPNNPGQPDQNLVNTIVDEDDLADGTDADKESTVVSQDILVDFGADGAGTVELAMSGDLAGMGLTSNGTALNYAVSEDGTMITATADGETVFTVTLNGDAESGYSYSFELSGALDHAAGDGENQLALPFDVVVTDMDGDCSSGSFTVGVIDDVPVAEALEIAAPGITVSVDEDDLADGTDGTKESLSATGALGLDGDLITIDYGADGPAAGQPTALGYDDLNWQLEGPTGLTSQGEPVTYAWDANTNTLQASADGRDIFMVELNADGTYTFTLQDSLDHADADGQNTMALDFSLTGTPGSTNAVDFDGDSVDLSGQTVTQTFSVNVVDDVPEATAHQPDPVVGGSGSEYLTVTNMGQEEASYHNTYGYYIQNEDGEPTTGVIIWSDTKNDIGETYTIEGIDPDTVGFFVIPNGANLNNGLTNGMEVTFEQDGNGNWQAVTENGQTLGGQGTAAIFSNEDLNVDGLDHTEDSSSPGNQNWEDIHTGGDVDYDDVNINVERFSSTVSVDEDDLADGTDDTKESLSASGTLGLDGDLVTIDYGADGPAAGAPTALGYGDLDWQLDGPSGLTSQGAEVTYTWDANTNTLQASADGRDVFTVELNADGTFTFTLQDSLDHASADGENSMDLEFSLTGTPDGDLVTDFDLDPALLGDVSINQTFSVNVVDDVPETGEVGQVGQADSVSLDEDDLADGTDDTKESLSATGDLGMDGDLITIDYGADGPADGAPTALGYDDLEFQLEGPTGLTSNGEAVTYTWDANTNTLQASAGGEDVFSVELNADGSYTFTLQGNLDHAEGQGENDLSLGFTLTGTPAAGALTDYDLDPSALDGLSVSQSFSVDVVDDVPQIGVVGGSVDEDDLSDGTDQSDPTSFTQSLTIDGGADGIASVELGGISALENLGLTSGGETVEYELSEDGQSITATANGAAVFTVSLVESNGAYSYSFELQGTLDHPVATAQDTLSLPFDVIVTDGDGDTVSGSVSVDVIDDVPTANMDCDFVAGGVGSSTTGNVITGVDTDNSGGSLQADEVGADDPGKVVSITFGDQTASFDNPADVKTDGNGQSYVELQGENGTLVMYADGNYEYTVTDGSDGGGSGSGGWMLGADDLTASSYDFNGLWQQEIDGHQVTVSARDAYGNNRDVSYGETTPGTSGDAAGEFRGIGIAGGGDSEIDGPEILEVDFGGNVVNNVEVGVRALFLNEQGGTEQGLWVAYRDGQEVGRGDFSGQHEISDRENTDGQVVLDINVDGGFDNVVFCVTTGNSDFFLEYMKTDEVQTGFTEEFSYTMEDSDGDQSSAILKFQGEDDGVTSTVSFDDVTAYEDDDATQSGQTNADGDSEKGDLAGPAEIEIGSQINLSGIEGDDEVTEITFDNLPEGATFHLGDTELSADGNGQIVLSGDALETFLGDQSLLTMTMPQHSDADVSLGTSVTVSDPGGDSQVFTGNIDVTLDAVADKPYDVSATVTVSDGEGFDIPTFPHDISNVVLYLQDDMGEFLKVKIDSFPGGGLRDPNDVDFGSFVEENYPGMELIAGITVKAGNNHPSGYGPGEGELFILVDGMTESDFPTGDKADETWEYNQANLTIADDVWGGSGDDTYVTVNANVTFADYDDGSETHFVLIEVPEGLVAPSDANLVTQNGATYVRVEAPNEDLQNTNGEFQTSVIFTVADESVGFEGDVNILAYAVEENVTDTELTLDNNSAVCSTTVSVDMDPANDGVTSTVDFSDTSVYEDSDAAMAGQTDDNGDTAYGDLADGVTADIGSQIDLSQMDSDDTVDSITIGGMPEGAVIVLDGTTLTANGSGEVVIEGINLETFLADQSSLVIDIPQHSDVDADLSVAVAVSDPEGGSETFSGTISVDVDAVADKPFDVSAQVTANTSTTSTGGSTTTLFNTTFEDVNQGFQCEADGWSTSSHRIEVWDEGGSNPNTPDGEHYIELNTDPNNHNYDAANIYRDIPTEEGTTYTLTFLAAGRPCYGADVNSMAVSVDGQVVETFSQDASNNTDHQWETVTVTFVGDGTTMRLQLAETGVDVSGGRGIRVDDITLVAEVPGVEEETVDSVTVDVSATFADYEDGSEAHFVLVELPDGWEAPAGAETVDGGTIDGLPDAIFVRIPVDNADIANGGGTVTVPVTLGAPEGAEGTDVTFRTFAEAYENNVSDTELTTGNNRAFTGSEVSLTLPGGPDDGITSTISFGDTAVYEDGQAAPEQQTDENDNGTFGDIADGVSADIGSQIDLSGMDNDDTVDTITISGLPAGAVIALGGQALAANGSGEVVIEGSNLDTFLADQSSLQLELPQHSDADVDLSVSVTVSDPDGGDSQTFDGTISVAVDAVADQPYSVATEITVNMSEGDEGGTTGLSPVAYWKLDETGGCNVIDSVGNAHGYTDNGTGQGYSGYDDGKAAKFDGYNDHIEIPHNSSMELANGTIQFWFKPDDCNGKEGLLSKDSSGYDTGGHLTIWKDGDGIEVRIQSENQSYTLEVGSGVSAGQWNHVAFSFGDDGAKLYLNGQLVDTDSYTGGLQGNYEPLILGANAWQTGNQSASDSDLQDFFDGKMDDVAFFDQQLSPEQVQTLVSDGVDGVSESSSGGETITLDVTTPDSNVNVNDVLADWAESGVTVEALNYNANTDTYSDADFSTKNVSFSINSGHTNDSSLHGNYAYSGISVGGGIDGGEIDTTDGNHQNGVEMLRVSFDNPMDTVTVELSALFDGETSQTWQHGPYDPGYLEKAEWTAFGPDGQEVSGTVSGTVNGLVEFTIDANFPITHIELSPKDDGAGNSVHNSDFLLRSISGESEPVPTGSVVESVTVSVTATFSDFTDGSESHFILVELPDGWSAPEGADTVDGGTIDGLPDATFVRIEVSAADIQAGNGTVTMPVTLGAPDGAGGTDVAFRTFAEAWETNVTDGEATTDNNRVFAGGETTIVSLPEGPDEADAPTLSVTDVSTAEDCPIGLSIDASLTDNGETLSVVISDVPAGASLSIGGQTLTADGNGDYVISGSQLDNIGSLVFTPADDASEDVTLSIAATSTTDDGDTATTTATLTVEVTADADAPTLTIVDTTVEAVASGGGDTITGTNSGETLTGGDGGDVIYGEGGNDKIYGGDDTAAGGDYVAEIDLSAALNDTDGSESLSVTISDLPDGVSVYLAGGDISGQRALTVSGGQVVIDGDDLDDLNTADVKLYVSAPEGTEDFDLSVTATSTDTDPDTNATDTAIATGTIAVSLAAGGSAAAGDTLFGGAGNDDIYGQGGDDTIDGGSGWYDDLYGGDGDDVIIDNGGADEVSGGAGDDSINISFDADFVDNSYGYNKSYQEISGGAGDDNILIHMENSSFYLNMDADESGTGISNNQSDGNDTVTLTGEYGWAVVDMGAGDDLFFGGEGYDVAYGGAGDDKLYGNDGSDYLYGMTGNDTLVGGTGTDTVDGGIGDDTGIFDASVASGGSYDGGAGSDTLRIELTAAQAEDHDVLDELREFRQFMADNEDTASQSEDGNVFTFQTLGVSVRNWEELEVYVEGNQQDLDGLLGDPGNPGETIYGDWKENTLTGTENDDTIYGMGDRDTIYGSGGDDTLDGGTSNDKLYGEEGDDTLYGGHGSDKLYGDDGNDLLDGGTSNDKLYGGEGNDTLFGDHGADTLEGGAGNDTLFGGTSSDTLEGGSGDDTLYGEHGNDRMYGGDGNDTLIGGSATDTLEGGEGDDMLDGGHGDDRMYGGDGNDTLDGGSGNDKLYGDAGDDLFIFGAGDGTDTASGGQGWDAVEVSDVSGDPSNWLQVDGNVGYTMDGNSIEFDQSASGSVHLGDGSTLYFEEIEEIRW
jgi:T1SS-143 domain-containing protein